VADVAVEKRMLTTTSEASSRAAGGSELDETAIAAVRGLARVSRMLEKASSELSLANYRVLAAIGSGDERASRVGRNLALGKPTVSATVDSLCQRGLVSRSSVGDDHRAVALKLTVEGQAVLDRVERAMVERIADLSARTPDGSRLMEALSWLSAAMDDALAHRAADGQTPAR
jgi:DNA-binding MarR family transcriptional regulator